MMAPESNYELKTIKSLKMPNIEILIVEDEPAIAKYIATTLESNHYKITALAFDHEDALTELKNNTPDLVLLDINLDDEKDGIDIAEIINKNYNIPFIFITSYANSKTIERAKITQPIGYIVKPFTEQDLISTLEISLYNHKQKNQPKALSIETVNAKLFTPLSQREFSILMGIYDGKSNQEIADTNFISINTIKTHIRNLYAKMDVSSRSELLVMMRKMV